MKTKFLATVTSLILSTTFAFASTNDLTSLIQKGLFEEEANHNLAAAMRAYQTAIEGFGKDRQLAATAIFRLGECYRKQGNTNEANSQYERIVREFPDQAPLVKLSTDYLGGAKPAGAAGSWNGVASGTSAEDEEIRRIRDMIQNSPDLINATVNNMTPLGSAASDGHLAVAGFLLSNGADVEKGSGDKSPLMLATEMGHKAMVEFLLAKGAKVNSHNSEGITALHLAARNGFRAVAEVLLAHGADLKAKRKFGYSPLHEAVIAGSAAMAELLIANHADVNARGDNGETPLFAAVRQRRAEMAEFLLAKGADIEAKDGSGFTALGMAVLQNMPDMARVLLSHNADANVLAKNGNSENLPLQTAISAGQVEMVDLLLANHADPNLRGSAREGATPLILAINRNISKTGVMVEHLLEHGADPNLVDEAGLTALHYAAAKGQGDVVKLLIAHHADVNAMDPDGRPPLALASDQATQGSGGAALPRPVPTPPAGRASSSENAAVDIKKLLLAAGANENFQRLPGIFLTQKGSGSIGSMIFYKGTNSVNRHSLFELIAEVYGSQAGPGGFFQPTSSGVPFPDFAHISINRLKADGSKEEIAVDLDEIIPTGDCSRDPALQWGDVVQIPQTDHPINEMYAGIPNPTKEALQKCLTRRIKITVKGQTTAVTLVPPNPVGRGGSSFGSGLVLDPGASMLGGAPTHVEPVNVIRGYTLYSVVHSANVLLISSDLSKVKVTRANPQSPDHPAVFECNLESPPQSDLLLLDGDVIDIPERDPNAPGK